MSRSSRLTVCLKVATLLGAGLAAFLSQPNSAAAFDRNQAQLFGVLPAGSTLPEGLAVAPNGDVYVATFDGSKTIVVFNQNGKYLRTITVGAASGGGFLGIAFHPHTGALLVIDFGGGTVLDVDKGSGTSRVFMTSPNGPAPASGLNALEFDSQGNVYVSDSFGGIIWRTGPHGGPATKWAEDALLKTAGDPPFGANGMGFNKAHSIMFVANTGNDTIVQIPVTNGSGGLTAGTPAIFTNSVNGADGLIVDDQDNLWVCANQSDEIVVIDKTGKVIAKLGDFEGLVDGGTPKGLLFPASPAFSRDKKTLYVTNLALDLRVGTGNPANIAVDSGWAAQVKHWTVSKIDTRFQPLPNK
jgi:sugar lactone lactonase YvrE